jgi:RNA polymerase sigma-70 factor (ECF subfamily)
MTIAISRTATALDTLDDAMLVAEAHGGSLAAFNTLVQRHEGAVYSVALRLVGRGGAAEDVAQDTFFRAYRALGRFQGSDFRPWLMRIATNRSYDELRRRRRAPESLDEYVFEPSTTWTATVRHEDPIARTERQELGGLLTAALGQLPFDQRVAIILSDVQGYDYVEIAAITGVSYGTVKSRLSRARARLRAILRGPLERGGAHEYVPCARSQPELCAAS